MTEPIFIEEWNGYKRGDAIKWRVQIANKKGTRIMEGTFVHIVNPWYDYNYCRGRVRVTDGKDFWWINQSSVVG